MPSDDDFLANAKPVQQQDFLAKAQPVGGVPQGTLSAGTPQPWLSQLHSDLEQGGGRTLPGRILGHMQGRGDKGYSGLNSGVSPDTAQFMGSPMLGATETAQGLSEIPQHPVKGALHTLSGIGHATEIPQMMMGGPEAMAGIEAVPSRVHAGKILDSIAQEAEHIPINPQHTQAALGDFAQHVATGGQGSHVTPLLDQRLAQPMPIHFPEGRQFYTNLSRETASPGILRRMLEDPRAPDMRRMLGPVKEGLNSDLVDAANKVGRGQDLTDAMTEYGRAAKLNKAVKIGGAALGAEGLRRTGIPTRLLGTLGKMGGLQ